MFSGLASLVAKGMIAREEQFLLKAHLACLVDGIELGHIRPESAKRFREVFGDKLKALGFLDESLSRTPLPLEASAVWREFAQTATIVGQEVASIGLPHKLADSREAGTSYGTSSIVTIAPLHYHHGLIREGAVRLGLDAIAHIQEYDIDDTLNRDEIRDCVRALKHRLLRMPPPPAGYLKGKAEVTVWATPVLDEISRLVSATLTSPGLLAQWQSTGLRNILGLWSYIGPKTRPLAAFFLQPTASLYAPNAITAGGYPRFRHRPRRFSRMAPAAGLTYNLDRGAARKMPGVAEVVTTGVQLSHVADIVACGCPDDLALTSIGRMAAHRSYWTYLAEKRSLSEILAALERHTT